MVPLCDCPDPKAAHRRHVIQQTPPALNCHECLRMERQAFGCRNLTSSVCFDMGPWLTGSDLQPSSSHSWPLLLGHLTKLAAVKVNSAYELSGKLNPHLQQRLL